MRTLVKFAYNEDGFDRAYYKTRYGHLYCEQQGIWYRCSKDGEPSHQVFDVVVVTSFSSE
jgi:hypothetical protein